jgi:hypothetical protein
MATKTLALITGLVFLTAVLVFLAIQKEKPVTKSMPTQVASPSPTPRPKTQLYLFPNPVLLNKNTAEVSVIMDAKDNEVTAVQMELSYDPRSLSFISITPSDIFQGEKPMLNIIDKKNGRISYGLGLPASVQTGLTGQQEIARLLFTRNFYASQSASTPITFLPKSLVTAKGAQKSVLTETAGTVVLFSSPSANILRISPTR